MKPINTLAFISEAVEELTDYKMEIRKVTTFEAAKSVAAQMLGFINCLHTFSNAIICEENNKFTSDFDEVLDNWQSTVYQELINKAIETKQSDDIVFKLMKKRNETIDTPTTQTPIVTIIKQRVYKK